MTTVVNTPGERNDNDNGAGWAVAVIILLVVIGIGAYLWANNQGAAVPAVTDESDSGQTNINVSLPGTSDSGTATTTP